MSKEMSHRDRRDLQLLRRYRQRDDRHAYDELIHRYTGLVRSYARKYAERGELLEDLEQVGMIGLVRPSAVLTWRALTGSSRSSPRT